MNCKPTRLVWILVCTAACIEVAEGRPKADNAPPAQQSTNAPSTQPAAKPHSAAPEAAPGAELESVLTAMDQNAAKFRAAEADFVWKIYNSVVNDFAEVDKGKIYFRRAKAGLQLSAIFTDPPSKQFVYSGNKVEILQPGGQEDEYDTSAHREELETFLVLGFGSSGQDIRKSFDVKYLGEESVLGTQARKLQLVPKAENVKNHVPKILLWIDPARGLSVQQQISLEDGDYRLAQYSNIQLRDKLPDNMFKLKGNVKNVVRH
jgi:outer membrane lipoprotein-sorting protein